MRVFAKKNCHFSPTFFSSDKVYLERLAVFQLDSWPANTTFVASILATPIWKFLTTAYGYIVAGGGKAGGIAEVLEKAIEAFHRTENQFSTYRNEQKLRTHSFFVVSHELSKLCYSIVEFLAIIYIILHWGRKFLMVLLDL